VEASQRAHFEDIALVRFRTKFVWAILRPVGGEDVRFDSVSTDCSSYYRHASSPQQWIPISPKTGCSRFGMRRDAARIAQPIGKYLRAVSLRKRHVWSKCHSKRLNCPSKPHISTPLEAVLILRPNEPLAGASVPLAISFRRSLGHGSTPALQF
jgi:hypothetical protein